MINGGAIPRLVALERPTITTIGVEEIFADLPPVHAVIPALDVCPGAPIIVGGLGFSMKTLSMQALALAVALGIRVWGAFPCTRGRVLHVDGEQGHRLTCERYQRLAKGLGVGPAELRDRLSLAVMPEVRLDSPFAIDVYSKACDGFDVAIFDSLRALTPSADENSSEIRTYLDLLGRVSETTGVVPIVIHHARKPHSDAMGGAKMSIRGSSAIFDACGSVLVFSGEKGKPVRVQHEKARTSGVTHDDFALSVEDIAAPNDLRWGVRVTANLCGAPAASKPSDRLERNMESIRRTLTDHAGKGGVAGKSALRALSCIGSGPFEEAFSKLVDGGEIKTELANGKPRLFRNVATP